MNHLPGEDTGRGRVTARVIGRWIAVFPAAMIGFAIARLLAKALIAYSRDDGGFGLLDLVPTDVITVIAEAVGAWGFIALGTYVAPFWKGGTAVVLVTIWTTINLAFILILIGFSFEDDSQIDALVFIATPISIAVAVIAAVHAYQNPESYGSSR